MLEPERVRNRELLKRFRAGDREAFTAVYRAHHPAVFRFALHMTADPIKAADVTQDVFVWLIHHAEDFDPERGDLGAFLTGVARKFLQRRRQEELRWVLFDEKMAEGTHRHAGPEPDTSDADRLRAAIAALPERYREAVALCDLEGKSYEEAAVMLRCAVGTVRSRLHRARGLLARKLQGELSPTREAPGCEAGVTWSK
ncbi:MAG: sigma-70 family RNA polymerase sigma factor [Acidobacteriota bacterium]